jgi:hypothetical protein
MEVEMAMPHPRRPGPRFLNGVRKGMETHAAELNEAIGGHLHRLLESRNPNLAAPSITGSADAAVSPPADSSSVGSFWTRLFHPRASLPRLHQDECTATTDIYVLVIVF